MKNYTKIKYFVSLSFLLLILGCNAESYVEGEGFLTETEGKVENGKGSLTIYTNSPFACSSGLSVYVDDESKATLREHKISGTPNCGEKSNSAVTLLLTAGSHKIQVKGGGSVFCPSYKVTYVTIEKGRCLILQLG
ncbi:hypothetical protein [Flavobacterium sp. 245]|uniref:hypothetical protein n=1 Tax=Flavobacterium sp. 245 TaxID=2512115 RepID=UPI001061CF86|nr:hypothetical protein [Flavobacterium sp. 245]TDO99098.1 hypothetical protein EV145_1075 [Flavobacterium sp. 245]